MENRYIVIVVAEGAYKSALDCNLDKNTDIGDFLKYFKIK